VEVGCSEQIVNCAAAVASKQQRNQLLRKTATNSAAHRVQRTLCVLVASLAARHPMQSRAEICRRMLMRLVRSERSYLCELAILASPSLQSV